MNPAGPLLTDRVTADSMKLRRLTIIGAGLLGGSFGLAIRERFHVDEIIGVSRSPSSRDEALKSGAVTSATDDVEAACDHSNLVVVAVPVNGIVEMVLRAAKRCDKNAMIIDLGSTKASIVNAIDQHESAAKMFVGTHPIAGSEKTGAENARADLFVGKAVILTPSMHTSPALFSKVESLWLALGSRVFRMTPEEHDATMASISHVPHLVASMLAALLAPDAGPVVGSGWLDTTRVASGDPDLWTAICQENSAAIIQELATANRWLANLSDCIEREDFDRVRQLLERSKQIRDTVVAARGK